MTSMNISIPDELKAYVENRVNGSYGNASEYVRELIRRDRREQAERDLDEMIFMGLESPVAVPLTDENRDEYWQKKMERVRARLEARAKKAK